MGQQASFVVNKKGGFKYYGPPGRQTRAVSTEVSETGELIDPSRPPVANTLLLLPSYSSKELVDILCSILPKDDALIRQVSNIAGLPKRCSVVDFIEQLALALQDLDQERMIVRGADPAVFWTDFQDRVQRIALKRLSPKKYSAILYSSGSSPFSNVSEEERQGQVEDPEKEENDQVQKEGGGDDMSSTEQKEKEGGEDELESNPLKLRLIIPDISAPMAY